MRYLKLRENLKNFTIFTSINVVPKEILLSQKIFSVLNRNRIPGRDLYDIIFLPGMSKPDKNYLINKIGTGDIGKVKKLLISKINGLDLIKISQYVKSFLFDPQDAKKIELFPDYLKSL